MSAGDPTYPLYPIACFISSVMLLLVLLTSFIRLNWNLGVAFLCFWLFWENLTSGANAIIWSDNADIKLYIYCDIVTHIQMIAFIVKPMATLIITRRLYLIASLRSVELPDKAAKRRDLVIEWTLGLGIPILVAGPFYYIVQGARFAVYGGFGCESSADGSILGILLIPSWAITSPLLSVIIYYPRILRNLSHHRRDMNRFLQSNNSVSRMSYFRIFALASIDAILTLPLGIVTIVLAVTDSLAVFGHFPVYGGWSYLHTNWEPVGFSYTDLLADGTSTVAQNYFSAWSSPILAFAIFGLFGVTTEARASYWHVICTVGGWFGWKPTLRTRSARSPMGTMEFGERPQDTSFNLDIESQPSYIDRNERAEKDVESEGRQASNLVNGSHSEISEEPRVVSDDTIHAVHPAELCGYELAKPVNAAHAV
ncbi:STE3-domain-containing protein [Peniophora sp. CONT]|nr:STE3-domain-containing protein [Peniophora sp. CONT]